MKKAKQILLAVLRTGIGIALVAYLGTSGAIDWRAFARLFAAWKLMIPAVVLLLLDALMIAWRLVVLLGPRGFHLPLWPAFRLTMIGVFFNSCLPGATGGDLVKIYYAAEGNPGRRIEVATIVLFDRAIGMFALLLLPLLLAPFFTDMIAASAGIRTVLWLAAGIGSVMVMGTLLSWWEPFARGRLVQWVIGIPRIGKYLGIVFETVHSFRAAPGTVLAAVVISLGAHIMAAGVAMISALATHPQEFAWKMSVVIPLGFTVNALPFTPGGLGVGEAAFNKLFALTGLSGGAEALLGWRLLTILIGMLGLAFYLQGRKRFVHDIETMRAAEVADSAP